MKASLNRIASNSAVKVTKGKLPSPSMKYVDEKQAKEAMRLGGVDPDSPNGRFALSSMRYEPMITNPKTRIEGYEKALRPLGSTAMIDINIDGWNAYATLKGKDNLKIKKDGILSKIAKNPMIYHSAGLNPGFTARQFDWLDSYVNKEGQGWNKAFSMAKDYVLGLDYKPEERLKGLLWRHGSNIASGVALSGLGRIATGSGSFTTNEHGQHDIAGIPFI